MTETNATPEPLTEDQVELQRRYGLSDEDVRHVSRLELGRAVEGDAGVRADRDDQLIRLRDYGRAGTERELVPPAP